jgi:hypothetical protein
MKGSYVILEEHRNVKFMQQRKRPSRFIQQREKNCLIWCGGISKTDSGLLL